MISSAGPFGMKSTSNLVYLNDAPIGEKYEASLMFSLYGVISTVPFALLWLFNPTAFKSN